MLDFVDMTALRAVRLIDGTLSVGAVFRIFNFMRLSSFVNARCYSRARAISHAAKLQLSPIDHAVFVICASEVCTFEARGAA